MAGMFSMLNSNFRSDGTGNGQVSSSLDDGGGGSKNASRLRKQASKRQNYILEGTNGLKKGFWMPYQTDAGKHRFFDLHPALRRSVCTLILAILAVLCGIVVILIDYLILENKVSIVGLTILSVGLVLIIIGLVWFFKSKQQLMLKWEKWEKARLKKIRDLTAAPFEKSGILPLTLMTSKHTAKWPSRKNCVLAECQVTMTSPNGNHYVVPWESCYSDSEDEVLPTNRKYDAMSHALSSNDSSNTFTSKNVSIPEEDTFYPPQRTPIRIAKNGEYIMVPVSRTEQRSANSFRSTSSDDDETTTSLLPRISLSPHN